MEILYNDTNLIVCVKPIGLDSEHDVPEALKKACGGEIYTLHRLDKNVGGVMIYARNAHTASILSKVIQEGKMIKEYVALVHGHPKNEDILEDFLFKDSRKNKVFVVKKERKGVKKASLEYHVIQSYEDTSLVHIKLHTGRSHQIRVQFSSRGYPLVGDHKYGSKDKKTEPMLFSCKISVPYKKENKCFEYFPDWAL